MDVGYDFCLKLQDSSRAAALGQIAGMRFCRFLLGVTEGNLRFCMLGSWGLKGSRGMCDVGPWRVLCDVIDACGCVLAVCARIR